MAARLRRWREETGLGQQAAAQASGLSSRTLQRMEKAKTALNPDYVATLMRTYGHHDEAQIEAMRQMAATAEEPGGWWWDLRDAIPTYFGAYLTLEEHASEFREYAPQFCPELLQTEGYARSLLQFAHPSEAEGQIDRRVRLRLERQQVLLRDPPPMYMALVEEAALRRPPSRDQELGTKLLLDQLDALIVAADSEHLTVRVLPTGLGPHGALNLGPFTHLRFSEQEIGDVVYAPQPNGARLEDGPEASDTYHAGWWEAVTAAVHAVPDKSVVDFLVALRTEIAS
ncbi:helix-turn-helix transcriptional regulator [Streptomyces sp. NPDC007083]|uniref:helix-turn-helix domain-containing protein n=1 Tax=Streptomyces sp. NPDC007083 TaxID=3156913 RepID=UPI00340FFC6D